MKKLVIAAMMLAATGVTAMCAVTPPIVNGEVFPDTEGNHINAELIGEYRLFDDESNRLSVI